MASDLSSGCTEDIEIFDEKEEGEISLEDVSSSEESHPNYRSGFRTSGRCTNCMSLQQCSPWCNARARNVHRKTHRKKDADHGKENRRQMNDSSCVTGKHVVSTLQEKNDDDDLVPISSDSDMEIVGLPGNSKHIVSHSRPKTAKVRKKKRKKRNHDTAMRLDEPITEVDSYVITGDSKTLKNSRTSRSHRRDSQSPRYNVIPSCHPDRPIPRSPPRRHRTTGALKSRSPPKRSKSPALHHSNSIDKKLPRKFPRSPRRSSSRSPTKISLSREPRESASSQAYVDVYASKLLKKVRRLESVGTFSPRNKQSRNKEHSSLREKLSNMMRKDSATVKEKESSQNGTSSTFRDNNNVAGMKKIIVDDDDDDIELLRRLALETKQKKTENKNEEINKAKPDIDNVEGNPSDDNDSEALELRMIALHSAVMKKHQDRVERGVKASKCRSNETKNESPFTYSFLDNISITGEFSDAEITLSGSQSPITEEGQNNPEDMELDTDVEREKEKDSMPYSPTDDLTSREIVIETELSRAETREIVDDTGTSERNLNAVITNFNGLEISAHRKTVNDKLYSPSVPTIMPKIVKTSVDIEENVKNANNNDTPYSPERSGYESNDSLVNYLENPDAPYSPSKPVEVSEIEDFPSPPKNITNIETPYSPTDTPIYDPELTRFSLCLSKNNEFKCQTSKDGEENVESIKNITSSKLVGDLTPKMLNFSTCETDVEIPRRDNVDTVARNEKNGEGSTLITSEMSSHDEERKRSYDDIIEKLPDVDLDGSPLVLVTKECEAPDGLIPIGMTDDIITEPLYLQGLPDVTRDTNKIPTLVNRTLVPVPILKTNKQLQQPLPQKKLDIHIEPSFKSAEMRPVIVNEVVFKPTALFKPIKLCPISKKPQIMTTTTSAAFNASFGDEATNETEKNEKSEVVQAPEMIRDSSDKTESATMKKTKSKSLTPERAQEQEKTRKKIRKSDRKSTMEELKSASPLRERASTGRTKSVPSNVANLSKKRRKSSSSVDPRTSVGNVRELSRRKRSNDNGPEVVSSTRYEKTVTSHRETLESSSEISESKKTRKRSVYREERKNRMKNRIATAVASTSSNPHDESTRKSAKQSTLYESEEKRDELASARRLSEDNKVEDKGGSTDLKKTRDGNKDQIEKERRCSLDEDEEALRALLLASLPKRPKPTETSASTVNPIVKMTQLSDTTITDTSLENFATKLPKESTACTNDLPVFTTPKDLILSSQSSSPASSTAKIGVSKNIEMPKKIIPSESNSSSSISSSPLPPRKRPGAQIMKIPPKKIAKKVLPVLASTKVVNNAKRYQNALLQKKLNLQRAASSYITANGSRNITLNNLKINDTARPLSPKITVASKMQRLVINLESDTDSETELQSQTSSSTTGCGDVVTTETRKPLAIPTTDFEKSVVQFLKDQRKKLESVATSKSTSSTITTTNKSAAPSTSSGKLSGVYSTPLAVRRHLPVSQQEEYRRLKQQIMERERQMLQKTIESGSILQNPPCTPPGPLSPATPNDSLTGSNTQITRVTSVAAQIPGTILTPSTEKCLDKIDDENRSNINVTKVPKKIIPQVPTKSLVKSPAASTKVNPSIPNTFNIPTDASTPKASAVFAQSLNISEIPSNAAKTLVPSVKSIVPLTMENREIPVRSEASIVSTRLNVQSSANVSTGVSTVGKGRVFGPMSSISKTSATSGSPSNVRSSLKPTEMLTIQIPNDKIQTNRTTSLRNLKVERNGHDTTNDAKSVGTLRILTKEQLNNRFVKIQVERGPAGRRVTVSSPMSPDDFSRMSNSPLSRIFNEISNNKTEEVIFCDNSLSVNESNEGRRDVTLYTRKDGEESRNECDEAESEASTLILPRNENTLDDDSAASTLILTRDNSATNERLESTRSQIGSKDSSSMRLKQGKIQIKEVWEKIRTDVKAELETLKTLPRNEQEKLLMDTQKKLVAKRSMVLEDLTEISGCLRQWEVEREFQTKLIAEVRKLREQLKMAEDRLYEQRRQMNDMGPRVTKTHEKINHGRRECYKLSRICQGLGARIIGEDYKVPNTGALLLNERLKEVAVHTRQLSKKKTSSARSPLSDTRDDISLSPSTSVEIVEDSWTTMNKSANHEDATSGSMNDSGHDEDDGAIRENTTECSIVSTAETNVRTNDRKYDESANILSPGCPADKTNPPNNENEGSSITITDAPDTDNERSSLIDMNFPEHKNEESSLNEINGIKNETETSSKTLRTNISSNETIVLTPSDVNSVPMENEVSVPVETDKTCDSQGNVEAPTSIETNLTSIIPDDNQAEDVFSMPSTSRSVSPPFRLLTDAQRNGEQKLDHYNSVLAHFKIPRNVNPNGILCPYELMGTCNDGDCQYYHLDPDRHCQ